MRSRLILGSSLALLACYGLAMATAGAADLLPDRDLKSLAVQKYWDTQVPLSGGAVVSKVVLLDDAAYVLTDTNVVFALHAPTGVIRWSNVVGEIGQVVRGPTHAGQLAFFTAPGSVHVMNRQTGEPTGEPRTLRGAIIDVVHDTATIAIGSNHGVRLGDVLDVKRRLSNDDLEQEAMATLRITVVDTKKAKGRLTRLSTAKRATLGDVAMANVMLPLSEVKLPFAATSAAVGDDLRLFVGAANQRFYSLNILDGFQRWQLLTPNTVSATPVLLKDVLYIVGQDGRVISLNKEDRTGNWTFDTEGPIFAAPAVEKDRVFVASTDRSLYCLDAQTGRRVWRERFDTQLREAPVVCEGRLFQRVPERGLFVMDAATGKALWHRQEPASFMAQFGNDAYLFDDEVGATLIRVDAATGKTKAEVGVDPVAFVTASQADQSVILATAQGQIMCLRSEKAPRLTPARMAEALRNDAKIQARAKAEAELKAAKAKTPAVEEAKPPMLLFEDDWLTSTSKTEPLGGRTVGTPQAKEKDAKAAAEEEEEGDEDKAAPKEEGEDEDEEGTDEAGMGADEEESKDAAAGEDDDSEDKSDDEGGDE